MYLLYSPRESNLNMSSVAAWRNYLFLHSHHINCSPTNIYLTIMFVVFCCSCFFNKVCFVLKFSKGFCSPTTSCMQSIRLHIHLWHLDLNRDDTYFGPAYWTVSAYKVVVKQNAAKFRSRLSCFCIKPPKIMRTDKQHKLTRTKAEWLLNPVCMCTFNFTGGVKQMHRKEINIKVT